MLIIHIQKNLYSLFLNIFYTYVTERLQEHNRTVGSLRLFENCELLIRLAKF